MTSDALLRGLQSDPLDEAEQVLLDAMQPDVEFGSNELAALCAERPDLAAGLRNAYASLSAVRAALRAAGSSGGASGPTEIMAGRFRALEEIGRGGMSVVISAWDTSMRRKVALKCVRAPSAAAGPISSHLERRRARLVNEAQVLAQLEHPGIVPVYDIVRDEHGEVYVAMQRVRGDDLRKVYRRTWAGDHQWSLARVVGVLQRACEAVAYAHEKGVLHRDLKPANVMVGAFGETFVMDWGLARTGQGHPAEARSAPTAVQGRSPEAGALDLDASLSLVVTDRDDSDSGTSSALYTQEGDVLGTPSYMSPEQASGRLAAIDARADVYGAGAMLYELLARHAPYLREGEPQSSVQILAALLAGPPAPLGSETRHAPVELVSIAEKAMARDREQRYATMRELADDLRAFLEGRAVRAHRTGALVELRKWIARNKLAAAALAIAVAGLVVFAVVQVQHSRTLSTMVDELREREYRNQMGLAAATLRGGDVAEAQRLLHATRPELRGWEWHALSREFLGATWSAETHRIWTLGVEFAPDGATVLAAGGNPSTVISRWDANSGALLAESIPAKDVVYGIEFGADASEIFMVRGRDEIVAVDPDTLAAREPARITGLSKVHGGLRIFNLIFHRPTDRLFIAGEDARVSIWDARSGALDRVLETRDGQVHNVAITSEGERAITVSSHGVARVWDLRTGEQRLRVDGNGARIDAVALDPEERRVVFGDAHGNIWVCDLASGDRLAEVARLPQSVQRLCWSSELGVLAAASGAFVRLFDTRTWVELPPLVGHRQTVLNLAIAPAGTTLASVSIDGGIRVWDLATILRPTPVSQHPGVFDRVAFDPVSAEGLLIYDDGAVAVWDPSLTRILREFRVPGVVRHSSVAPDGAWLSSVSVAGSARITDTRTGALVREFPPAPDRFDQCWAIRSSRRVYLATILGRVTASSLDSDEPLWACEPVGASMDHMALTPDAQRLLVSASGSVACMDAMTGRIEWRRAATSQGTVLLQDIDPQGRNAMWRTYSGATDLVDLADGRTLWSFESGVSAFDRAGQRVYSAGAGGELVVVDRRTGERIANLPGRGKQLERFVVSPDGNTVLGVVADGRPVVWDGAPQAAAGGSGAR